jgi:hypothetical protein
MSFEKTSVAVDEIDRHTRFFMAYLCLQYHGGPDAQTRAGQHRRHRRRDPAGQPHDIRVRLRGDQAVAMDNFGADWTFFDPLA